LTSSSPSSHSPINPLPATSPLIGCSARSPGWTGRGWWP
jgi:hypothetical protein